MDHTFKSNLLDAGTKSGLDFTCTSGSWLSAGLSKYPALGVPSWFELEIGRWFQDVPFWSEAELLGLD